MYTRQFAISSYQYLLEIIYNELFNVMFHKNYKSTFQNS